ncbi:MAG: ABC transporter substrate-binding protein [Thermodesulfobacteriota bacterium]|nr:ABC transporter substrate-binding protein [Thermodesulfobacteriota bacterium]
MRSTILRKSHLILATSLINLLFFGTEFTFAKEVRGVTEDTIKIGLICDLTGPVARTWTQPLEAMRTYFLYMNDQGGIHGRSLKLIIEDDRYSIPMAISSFKKIVYRDKVLAFIGPGSSGGNYALFSLIKKEKIPNITPAMSDAIVHPPKRYIFSVGVTYSDEYKVMLDYIVSKLQAKKPRIAIVYPDNEPGKSGLKSTRQRAKFYGLKLVSEQVVNFGALDATSQILNLKRAKTDYVVIVGVISSTVCVLRDAKKFGLSATFLGMQYTCSEDTVRTAGEAAKNFIGTHCFSSWYDNVPGMSDVHRITLKYHPGTEKPYRSKFYTSGWITSLILIEGLKRAGKKLSGESLVESMESLKDFDTGGLSGPITYGPNRRKATDYVKLYKADIENGLLVPITGWMQPKLKR